MKQKTAFKRHAQDQRIVIVDSLEDFELWRERHLHGISGIICDYPLPPKTIQEAADHIVRVARTDQHTWWSYREGQEGVQEHNRQYTLLDLPATFQRLHNDGITGPAYDITTDLTQLYMHVADEPDDMPIGENMLQINVNSTRTIEDHKDPNDTLAFAFSRGGTDISSKTQDSPRHPKPSHFSIDHGQVLLIDSTIVHKTPRPEKNWHTDPRVSLVI